MKKINLLFAGLKITYVTNKLKRPFDILDNQVWNTMYNTWVELVENW